MLYLIDQAEQGQRVDAEQIAADQAMRIVPMPKRPPIGRPNHHRRRRRGGPRDCRFRAGRRGAWAQRNRLIASRVSSAAWRAAAAKSLALAGVERMAREELIIRPVPAFVLPALTVASMSPPWAPMPGTSSSGMSPVSFAHAGNLGREGGADDQRALAGGVPLARHQPGDALVELHAADVEELQVAAARVRGAAEQDHALVPVGQVGFGESRPMYGLAVMASAWKRSKASIAYCSAVLPMSPRLASRITGMPGWLVDVRDQRLQLVLGAARGEVGDLRLEAAHQVGRGIDDALAEFEDGVVTPCRCAGNFAVSGSRPTQSSELFGSRRR